MKILDFHPEYLTLPEDELIPLIPGNILLSISSSLSEYYDSKLSMSSVYNIYGVQFIGDETQQQVHCLLPQHGTGDKNPSARYYPTDRNTGASKPAVYCHKCQKTNTPFWLLYQKEAADSGIKMREFYGFLKKTFQIPFPRHIYLNFDPEVFFTLSESEGRSKKMKIQYAEILLKLKYAKDPLYLSELKKFWQEI